MRRRWKLWLLASLLAAGGAGGYLYQEKQETGEIARALWHELDDYDHAEAVADPLFADLKSGGGGETEVSAATPTPSKPAAEPKPAPAQPVQPIQSSAQVKKKEQAATTPAPEVTPVPAKSVTQARTQKPEASATSAPAPPPAQTTQAQRPQPQAAPQTPQPQLPQQNPQATPSQAPAHTPGRYDAGSSRPNPHTNNVHILLVGNDQERIGKGRADSIMLVTLNPGREVLEIVSVPRDTWVDIPHHGFDKVNHAYQFGGVDLLNHTLQRFFGFPFQYYVEISQGGFRSLIDQVGGVDVDVPFSFTYEGHTFQKGPMHLNGETALAYSRMRKLDPRGAFGREDRQKQIVGALLRRLGEIPLSDSARLNDLARQLIPYVRTDLGPRKVVALRRAHPYALDRTERLSVQGQGRVMKGIYYYVVEDGERRRLHLALR
ncbi:LCP family protein [Deinococcus sp. YIM 134068]|uniref:LCP family protein n=1 Tax=Deinococcus lichenicola TaxID=3118910 RepID=UPI002F92B821